MPKRFESAVRNKQGRKEGLIVNPTDPGEEQQETMSLVEHLGELRKRLIVVVIFFLIATLVSFQFVNGMADKLMELGKEYRFVYLSPSELFMQYIWLSVIAAIVLTAPVILYELWKFICPGLKKREKTAIGMALFTGFFFFIAGAVFSYFVIIPVMLRFFISSSAGLRVEPMISIANYIGFITSNMLTFGLIFEMPVLVMALTQIGLLQPKWLAKNRGTVIVVIFILAAIITPPDAISLTIVAVPMVLLYELSITLGRILQRGKRQRQIAETEAV